MSFGDRAADIVTRFSGTWTFLLLHGAWWIAWWLLSLPVDSLTLWVSLEAIVLSSLVLMSQSRQSERDRKLMVALFKLNLLEQEELDSLTGDN